MRWLEAIVRRPAAAALLVAALAAAALPIVARLDLDNAIELWTERRGQEARRYEQFLERFGSEEFILLIFEAPTELDREQLLNLTDLRLDLEQVQGVARVFDLSAAYTRFGAGAEPAAFYRRVRSSPFYRNLLISADGRLAAAWISLQPAPGAARSRVVGAVRQLIADSPLEGPIHLAGPPVVNVTLDELSRRGAATFFPLVFVLSALVLLARFRSLWGVLIPYLSVGAGIVLTLGVLGATGRSLNMVTVALPAVVWVLGLSTSVHLVSRWRWHREMGTEGSAAIAQALRDVARPCLFSALTTALGFASLGVSRMQPVREMGLFSALGVLLCLATNLLLFPALARLWKRPPLARSAAGGAALGALAYRAGRRPGFTLAAAALLAAAAAGAMLNLRAEANVIEFLRPDEPLARTYRQLLPGFTGAFSLEVVVTPEAGEPPSLPLLARLDRLASAIASEPRVGRVLSALDLVREMHGSGTGADASSDRLPETEEDLRQAWAAARRAAGDDLESFYHAESGSFRLSVLSWAMSSRDHRRLVEAIRGHLAEHGQEAWRPRITGIVELLVTLQERLVESQIRSFALAFAVILPMIALLLRSARYALLSLPANLLPIALALGAMGAFRIALDPATVMIAAMALGIAADDTIHLLERYRRERHAGAAAQDGVRRALAAVAEPMALTSLVAALGFLALLGSRFVPLAHFGLLTAVTMGAALVGDQLVLPAVLLLADAPRRS